MCQFGQTAYCFCRAGSMYVDTAWWIRAEFFHRQLVHWCRAKPKAGEQAGPGFDDEAGTMNLMARQPHHMYISSCKRKHLP